MTSASTRPASDAVRTGYSRPAFWERHPVLVVVGCALVALAYGNAFATLPTSLVLPLMLPLGAIAILIIWRLPTTNRPPVRTLTGLLFLYTIALVTWPDYLAVSVPGLPWITAIRITGPPVALVLMICVSVSDTLRAELMRVFASVPWIIRPFLVFAATMILTLPLSPDIAVSIGRLIVAEINWIVMFFAAVIVFQRPGTASGFVRVLWICMLVTCGFGIAEWRESQLPWAEDIPEFLRIEDEAVKRALEGAARAATGIHRAASKWSTSLGFAEYLSLLTPFMIHAIVTSRSVAVRLFALAMLPLIFFCMKITDARLGMVGFMLSFMLYLLVWAIQRWRARKDSLIPPLVIAAYPAAFAAFIAGTFVIGRLRAMVWGTGAQQFSTDARKDQYLAGIQHVLSNPIGHGIGMGARTLGYSGPSGVVTIDTYYLAAALEFGVVGFVAFYGMILGAIYHGGLALLKTREREALLLAPIIVALTNFFIIKSIFSQLENHPIVFMMLGMVAALVYRVRQETGEVPAAAQRRAVATARILHDAPGATRRYQRG